MDLPQLKLHNHVQLYLRRVSLPSSAGSEIPASSICASGNLFCVASPVINLRQITITLLSDGGGGILPLSLPDNTGSNFHYLSVQIPLSARPGDTLKVQLADVCSQKTPIVVNELRSKEIQGRYPDFGANITGQVFRVLCARVPECATGDSTQPVNVYFKFKNSDLQEYCLIPSDIQSPASLINIAVPEDQPELSWLWEEHSQDLTTEYAIAQAVQFQQSPRPALVTVTLPPSVLPGDFLTWRKIDFLHPHDLSANLILPMLRQKLVLKSRKKASTFYKDSIRHSTKEQFPDAKGPEITLKLNSLWNELTPAQQAPFLQQAENDKTRYLSEKESQLFLQPHKFDVYVNGPESRLWQPAALPSESPVDLHLREQLPLVAPYPPAEQPRVVGSKFCSSEQLEPTTSKKPRPRTMSFDEELQIDHSLLAQSAWPPETQFKPNNLYEEMIEASQSLTQFNYSC